MADKGKFTPVSIIQMKPQQWPSSMRDTANAAAGLAEATYPGSEQWQGRGDAFRHIVWQALMAKKYGNTIANAVGQYHELPLGKALKAASPDQTSLEKEQDLYNNRVGREIASKANTMEDIYRLAQEAVDKGKARYLSPDEMEYQSALQSLEVDKAQAQY